jgi:Flp pilus assembly protein protease CpaA
LGLLVLPLALVGLLAQAAAQDLRTRTVSGWLTVPPLLAAVAWRVAEGRWELAVAFIAIALFSERLVCRGRGLALAAALTGLVALPVLLPGSPAFWPLAGWLTAWLLWECHVIGGADVKLMMLLVTVYPAPEMVISILLAKLAGGLVVTAAVHGPGAARRLLAAAWSVLVARQIPERETLEREGLPAAFLYLMAGVGYLLVFVLAPAGVVPPRETWGALALAYTLGAIPPALYLRSVLPKAGLRSVPRSAGPWPRSAGLRGVPRSAGPWTRRTGAWLPGGTLPAKGKLPSMHTRGVAATVHRKPDEGTAP